MNNKDQAKTKSFPGTPVVWFLFLAVLTAQVALSKQLSSERLPFLGLNEPPNEVTLSAMSLNDPALSHRLVTLALQEAGDHGGRVIRLMDYDYEHVKLWLQLSSKLSPESDYAPALAAYYFSMTPATDDLSHILDYLEEVFLKDPENRWRFLTHAVYLARHRLNDPKRAWELSRNIIESDLKTAPIWVRQLPAFALANVGAEQAAADLMQVLLESEIDAPPEEIGLMQRFIEERKDQNWFRPIP